MSDDTSKLAKFATFCLLTDWRHCNWFDLCFKLLFNMLTHHWIAGFISLNIFEWQFFKPMN